MAHGSSLYIQQISLSYLEGRKCGGGPAAQNTQRGLYIMGHKLLKIIVIIFVIVRRLLFCALDVASL